MEQELRLYLEWQLSVDLTTLCDFERCVHHDFAGPGPYPTVVLPQTAPAPFTHSSNPSPSHSLPPFAACVGLPSQDPLVIPGPRSHTHPHPRYPRGLSFGLDLFGVVSLPSNTSPFSIPPKLSDLALIYLASYFVLCTPLRYLFNLIMCEPSSQPIVSKSGIYFRLKRSRIMCNV